MAIDSPEEIEAICWAVLQHGAAGQTCDPAWVVEQFAADYPGKHWEDLGAYAQHRWSQGTYYLGAQEKRIRSRGE